MVLGSDPRVGYSENTASPAWHLRSEWCAYRYSALPKLPEASKRALGNAAPKAQRLLYLHKSDSSGVRKRKYDEFPTGRGGSVEALLFPKGLPSQHLQARLEQKRASEKAEAFRTAKVLRVGAGVQFQFAKLHDGAP